MNDNISSRERQPTELENINQCFLDQIARLEENIEILTSRLEAASPKREADGRKETGMPEPPATLNPPIIQRLKDQANHIMKLNNKFEQALLHLETIL